MVAGRDSLLLHCPRTQSFSASARALGPRDPSTELGPNSLELCLSSSPYPVSSWFRIVLTPALSLTTTGPTDGEPRLGHYVLPGPTTPSSPARDCRGFCALFQSLRAQTHSLTISLPVLALDLQFLVSRPHPSRAFSHPPLPCPGVVRPLSFRGPRGLSCPSHRHLGYQLPT